MYPVRFPKDSESGGRDRLWSDNRFRSTEKIGRSRARRARRYLFYVGLLAGLCVLLGFAGCGSNAGIGERKAEHRESGGTEKMGQSLEERATWNRDLGSEGRTSMIARAAQPQDRSFFAAAIIEVEFTAAASNEELSGTPTRSTFESHRQAHRPAHDSVRRPVPNGKFLERRGTADADATGGRHGCYRE